MIKVGYIQKIVNYQEYCFKINTTDVALSNLAVVISVSETIVFLCTSV